MPSCHVQQLGHVAVVVLLLVCAASTTTATECNSGLLQMQPLPLDLDPFNTCYSSPLTASSINTFCASTLRVRVKDGIVKIVPIVQGTYSYLASDSSENATLGGSTRRFDCKDLNASGLFYPGSTTSASLMLYDDFGGPLSSLTKTGASEVTLAPGNVDRSSCLYKYTVVKGCVLGAKAPTKPSPACPPGYYKRVKGRFGLSYCSPCSAGTYSSQAGAACKPCPVNTYSTSLGAPKCTKCPRDSFANTTGSTECNECSWYGNYYFDGKKCTACPKGSSIFDVSPFVTFHPRQCVRCDAGRRCCTAGWNKDCPKCTGAPTVPSKTYTAIFALETATPTSCLTNEYARCTPKLNITVESTCAISINNMEFDSSPDDTSYCQRSAIKAINGPQLRARDLTDPEQAFDFSSLLSGNFSTPGSRYLSVDFPSDFPSPKCTLRYRALTAAAATLLGVAPKPSKVTSCPAGKYLETKTDAKPGPCLPCPPGTYSPAPSYGRSCIRCAAGTFANQYGSVKCKKCPAGLASKPGAAECAGCFGSRVAPCGKGCISCPEDATTSSIVAGDSQCFGNAYGSVCCAAGNCAGQVPCKGPRKSTFAEKDETYTAVLQLVKKNLPQPACKAARLLSCLPADGKLILSVSSSNPTSIKSLQPYRTALTCANYTNSYSGVYTSTSTADVNGNEASEESGDFDFVWFEMISDAAKGTVTMLLSPPADSNAPSKDPPPKAPTTPEPPADSEPPVRDNPPAKAVATPAPPAGRGSPAKASVICSATFKLVSGYAFDLKPPKGAKCHPDDVVVTYKGRRFCQRCPAGQIKSRATGRCQYCPAGYFNDKEGAATCKPCRAGYSCSKGASVEETCSGGEYTSKPKQASCAVCPTNTYGSYNFFMPNTMCTACPKGTIAPKGAEACGVPWDKAFPA